jgi:hypothetical protein
MTGFLGSYLKRIGERFDITTAIIGFIDPFAGEGHDNIITVVSHIFDSGINVELKPCINIGVGQIKGDR